MRYLVNMCYDGTDYYGFQIQKDMKTIQGDVERILSKILNENINIVGCSRTDKGVHANDYYFHFETFKEFDLGKLTKSLNSLLDDSIYIKNIKEVDNEFHARYSVKDKEYLYVINTGEYCPTRRNIELEYNKCIDVELLKEASKYLIGKHDFKSFTSDNERDNFVRTINYIKFEEKNEILNIYINADGFLKYMVRNIVGLFLELNDGKKNLTDIEKILESKDRTMLGVCAPSVGLYLNKVNY